MPPTDRTKESGERQDRAGSPPHDDKSQRGAEDKLGNDKQLPTSKGRTDGEQTSDDMIREKEKELGVQSDLPPMGDGGGEGDRAELQPDEATKLRKKLISELSTTDP